MKKPDTVRTVPGFFVSECDLELQPTLADHEVDIRALDADVGEFAAVHAGKVADGDAALAVIAEALGNLGKHVGIQWV